MVEVYNRSQSPKVGVVIPEEQSQVAMWVGVGV